MSGFLKNHSTEVIVMLKVNNWWLISLLSHLKSSGIRTQGKIVGFADMDYLITLVDWCLSARTPVRVLYFGLKQFGRTGSRKVTL